MNKRAIAIASSILCFLIGVSLVALWLYHSATETIQVTAQVSVNTSSQSRPGQESVSGSPYDCRRRNCQLRKYEELESKRNQLRVGMTIPEVEQVLGKADYSNEDNNYFYCSDKKWFDEYIPLMVHMDKNNKLETAVFPNLNWE